MTTARLPQLGSVIWAEIPDTNGFRKVRPAVVVTATANILPEGTVRVLAITTRLPDPLPDDFVLLPWERQGKARSGLRRKCAAVTTWQAEIAVSDVQQVVGLLPPGVIEELLAKIASATPPLAAEGKVPSESETEPPAAPEA